MIIWCVICPRESYNLVYEQGMQRRENHDVKLWVDDIRPAPEGYIWCRSTNETIKYIRYFLSCGFWDDEIEVIDLDHDAGDYESDGGDYIKVLDWMVEKGYKFPVHIHTGNPVGRDNMWRLIKRYGIPEVEYEWE